MKSIFDNIECIIKFFINIGLLFGIPTLIIIALNVHEVQVNALKQTIDSIKDQNKILQFYQPDKAWNILEAQKKFYEMEKQNSSNKIKNLTDSINKLKDQITEFEIIQQKDTIIEAQKNLIKQLDRKINTMRKEFNDWLPKKDQLLNLPFKPLSKDDIRLRM